MMLTGSFAKTGYDWWWHSFTAVNDATGEEVPFFIEYFICNPKLAQPEPVFGQSDYSKQHHLRPSYLMVKAGCWGKNKCQLHRFFAWKDVTIEKKAPYNIQADDCMANETQIKGSIKITDEDAKKHPEYMCDAGEISWNLYVDKKIAYNVGYEKVFPIHSPNVVSIDTIRRGKVRRAKLYYLRDRVGKQAKVKEKL